jgi:predicted dehydrogenase
MKRRQFLQSGLAAGAGLLWASSKASAQTPAASDAIHVALIGAGAQGRVLINAALAIPGIRFRAVCDIWKYRRRASQYYLKTYGHETNDYADYQEMLAQEKDLQAVIVATPDFVHAEHTNACLKAGLHVYCEKMMSNSLDGAKSMVRTMRETKKLLQIGYQRRSNPRYLLALEKLLREAKLPGRLTHAAGQWGHAISEDQGWPKKFAIADDDLARYGYAGMHEFRNWRYFKKYGAGPFGDFGSHMVDVAQWFLGVSPRSVLAAGGVDYYPSHQWYDNVTAILEYPAAEGLVRASFQVLTTTSGGGAGNYEQFLGTLGTIKVSENPKWTKVYHEPHAPDWDDWARKNYLVKDETPPAQKPETRPVDPNEVRSQETGQVVSYSIPLVVDKPPHQPHLENFFDAVRGKASLACPADVALRNDVVVLKVNEAIEARKMLALAAEDFAVEGP